ncbi:MAG: hydroxymethylglutaryl-CoA lyase, partial [Psychrobacter sp.]
MSHSYPSHVTIVDVSPRDGLQNESMTVPTEVKQALINDLIDAGIKKLEVTSFVSPKWVPQMGDNSALLDALAPTRQKDVCYSVLVPNMRGFDNAIAYRPDEIVIFGSASETFSQKNINCSIDESIE